jgi:general secretion pathway protein C
MAPGVTVKEVQHDYVLLSDSGAVKRVELPESAKGLPNISVASPVTTARPIMPPPAPAPTPAVSAQPMARSHVMPPAAFQQPMQPQVAPQEVPPASQVVPPTSMAHPQSPLQSSGASGTSGASAAGAPAPAPSTPAPIQVPPQTSGVPATQVQPVQTVPSGAAPAQANPPR